MFGSRKPNQLRPAAVEEHLSSGSVALTQAVEEATADRPQGTDLPQVAEVATVDHHRHHYPSDQEEQGILVVSRQQETVAACRGQIHDS